MIDHQAIEEGNLDEVEGLKKLKKQRKRNYEYLEDDDDDEDEPPPSKSVHKVEKPVVKKRRGRPPVEKPQPNPPKLTHNMKKLVETMTGYKDGYVDGLRLALHRAINHSVLEQDSFTTIVLLLQTLVGSPTKITMG